MKTLEQEMQELKIRRRGAAVAGPAQPESLKP
jgi:hypothetical protein